jgi:hypothetical protein
MWLSGSAFTRPKTIMRHIRRFDDTRSSERRRVVLPTLNDADRRRGSRRGLSAGTRFDLIVLSLWLVAAGLAAVCIFSFLVYSSLAAVANNA